MYMTQCVVMAALRTDWIVLHGKKNILRFLKGDFLTINRHCRHTCYPLIAAPDSRYYPEAPPQQPPMLLSWRQRCIHSASSSCLWWWVVVVERGGYPLSFFLSAGPRPAEQPCSQQHRWTMEPTHWATWEVWFHSMAYFFLNKICARVKWAAVWMTEGHRWLFRSDS